MCVSSVLGSSCLNIAPNYTFCVTEENGSPKYIWFIILSKWNIVQPDVFPFLKHMSLCVLSSVFLRFSFSNPRDLIHNNKFVQVPKDRHSVLYTSWYCIRIRTEKRGHTHAWSFFEYEFPASLMQNYIDKCPWVMLC